MVVAPEHMPVAGRDYPGTWGAFVSWFPDDAACRAYLERLRWPDGFACPACGAGEVWRTGSGLWLCQECRHKTSVTSGTIFEGTRRPLVEWFAAAWYVTNQKNGVSALGLQHALGLGSYQTAWAWLHKLRRAMVRPDRDQLSGLVEVDETYVGGTEAGAVARGTARKAIVVVAVELLEPTGFGRIRMRRVTQASQEQLVGFVHDSVARGSTVRTDGWNIYARLAKDGYDHDPLSISAGSGLAHIELPGVHRVAALLKRWLAGTHQHAVSHRHLVRRRRRRPKV